jgi:ADP-ribose pyrophosphatase YjhB (NUDIX family)
VSKVTGKFVHHQAHSVHPEKGARGAGHMQEKHGMPRMMLQEVLTAAGVKEGDTVLDLCAGHQSMEEAAMQKGARYVAVDRVAKLKRSRKVIEGWAAVAIVRGKELLCFRQKVEGGQGEVEMMLPGGTRDAAKGETEHEAAMRHLEEQTGITQADCEEYLMDVPISVSSTYGARYFVYKVSEWDCSREMKMKMKQQGLEKEWVKFSKEDEQASVKPSKWRRWSEARREKHRERMWGHTQEAGAGQVTVQVGTGADTTQEVGGTPEGGRRSSDGERSEAQESKWRTEDKTATETIFRSLARKR